MDSATTRDLSGIVSAMANPLAAVLVISGATKTVQELQASIIDTSSQSMESILRHVASLQKLFYADVLSCELRLDVARYGESFDPLRMSDAGIEDEPDVRLKEVLCTVDVGLVSTGGVRNAESSTSLLKVNVVSERLIPELLSIGGGEQRHCERYSFMRTDRYSLHRCF